MKSNALLIIILIIIVAIVGIYFGYNMFFNKPNLTNISNESLPLNNTNSSTNITSSNNYQNLTTHTIISSNTTSANNYQNTSNNYLDNYLGYNQYIPIKIYNTQNIPTPSPFQQQIAICDGDVNIGPNFAYVNNATLLYRIHPNGQNVMFFSSNNRLLYSWYLGQFPYDEEDEIITCYIWWIKLDNGIPANSNVTIYMYIGNSSSNFYQQYYPYVGASPQVDPSRQYDNGKHVFIVYGYFNNTTDGWTGYVYNGTFTPTATPDGIQMLNNDNWQGTYILPPNNGNIPKIPLIVEEAWYSSKSWGSNVIALFGNTNQQIQVSNIGSTNSGSTPASNLSTLAEYNQNRGYIYLKSAVTNTTLARTYSSTLYWRYGTFYSYLIVNSTHAQAGCYHYSYDYDQGWAPLTLLNTYTKYNDESTSTSLNYNPFQYGTLQISVGTSSYTSYQYVQWVIARAYPPNGKMPLIYIG